jgi:hypothetical protein
MWQGYRYPIPKQNLVESHTQRHQVLVLKSSYVQEIEAGYFREGYYVDIAGSGYDDIG